ncbi:MAG: glycosyltransferase [Longimicrobiales bacterium]
MNDAGGQVVKRPGSNGAQGVTRTILHIIETAGPGGAETVMLRLIQGLDPERWRSIAVVPDTGWLLSSLRDAGVDTHVVPSSGSFDWRWVQRVHRLAVRTRAELVQTHLFGSAVYGGLIGRLRGIPTVSTIHGEVDVKGNSGALALKTRLLQRRRTQLIAVSESVRTKLVGHAGFPSSEVRVIPNGIDIDMFDRQRDNRVRSSLGWTLDDFVIGAVGNVRRPKDYGNLLQAAAILLRKEPRCRFVVLGDITGEPDLYRELCEQHDRLELGERFRFLGFRSDVAEILPCLDAWVMSSSREGLPLALLQAMAASRPIVATRCGGPEEVIVDGVNGMLVDAGAPRELAAGLLTVMQDPAGARMLGEAGHETVAAHYSTDAMVHAYESLYLNLLTQSGSTLRQTAV